VESSASTGRPRNKFFQASLCRLGVDSGPCSGRFPRWFFNAKSSRCEEFVFGGCHGNENNFQTIEECKRSCDGNRLEFDNCSLIFGQFPIQTRNLAVLPANICEHPLDHGRCNDSSTRWWFDKVDGFCKQFAYTGCDGNGNNFESRSECESSCSKGMLSRDYLHFIGGGGHNLLCIFLVIHSHNCTHSCTPLWNIIRNA